MSAAALKNQASYFCENKLCRMSNLQLACWFSGVLQGTISSGIIAHTVLHICPPAVTLPQLTVKTELCGAVSLVFP